MVKVIFSSSGVKPRPKKAFQELVVVESLTEFHMWSEKRAVSKLKPKWFSKHKLLLSLDEMTVPHLRNLRDLLTRKIVADGDLTTQIVRGNFVHSVKLRIPLSNWLEWVEYELSQRDAL